MTCYVFIFDIVSSALGRVEGKETHFYSRAAYPQDDYRAGLTAPKTDYRPKTEVGSRCTYRNAGVY